MTPETVRRLINKMSALKIRADADIELARADILDGLDPSANYERGCEHYRLYAEAQIDFARKVSEGR